MARDFADELARLAQEVKQIKRGQRYAHGGSLENSALEVKNTDGSLRAILGVQADGTTGVNIVNGPPPPVPSMPVLASSIGGITVSWDGTFADGAVPPMDWQRTEVHASTSSGFTPGPATLQTTIETLQGGTVVVPTEQPVYVRLLARNTSGAASDSTGEAGPLGPSPVVATDILDGIVTSLKLADDAVTAAKIAAGAVGTSELADAAVHAQQLADAAVEVGKIADNAVTGDAIASEAVTAGKLAANSVTAGNIQAGAVTAAKIAAGSVTTDKLTVTGGANVLTDPSFEGAYTASIISGLSFASQDTTRGNGSPTSLKIDAAAGAATNRAVAVTALPVQPGDQLLIGVDYWVDAAWTGSAVNVHVRWETAAGGVVSYGIASSGASPVREAWTRLSGTYTAPATAAVARLRIESSGGTAGAVWFDNASMRPVLGGTQIQDGAVTTQKVVAGAIQTTQLDAGAVNADKIASGAVTTAKLDALAVTSDKVAANAITAGKILAGAVTADKLEAVLQLVTRLVAGNPTGARVELNSDGLRVYNTGGTQTIGFNAADGSGTFSGTVTGSTVTGGVVQTATSGQRITMNEAGQNKILVYNSSGTAIGELSAQGLLVQGTNGSILALDPNNAYPNLRLTNAARTSEAVINVGSTNANLGLNSGKFTGSGFDDMKWRTYFGNDFWVAERIRDSSASTIIGGRVFLSSTVGSIGYGDTTNPSQNSLVRASAGEVQITGTLTNNGRPVPVPGAWASLTGVQWSTTPAVTTYQSIRIQSDGTRAYLDGAASTLTAFTGSQNAFTIPAGMRPLKNHYFGLVRATSADPRFIGCLVQSNGTITVFATTSVATSDTWDFSDISWPLD
ncbi:hypothetical protein ACF060_31605 [Streptomyces werraensis]|uniref:hypothetical protein n=1 Tax=Streptomyces werraensis TaxID=68284 RepID=UPI0036F79587